MAVLPVCMSERCGRATNHLGHFALTKLLLPKLKAAAPSRIVNVASVAHEMAPSPMTPEQFPPPAATYGEWSNYGISKFSNVLHAKQIQRLHGDAGITAVSVHPGERWACIECALCH